MVAVVAGGGVSREIAGAGCAAGLPGARMAGAAGAAVTADVKKEEISTMAIVHKILHIHQKERGSFRIDCNSIDCNSAIRPVSVQMN